MAELGCTGRASGRAQPAWAGAPRRAERYSLRVFLLTHSRWRTQGSKRVQEAAEARAAKLVKKATDDERDPKLPKSVPLPKTVSEVKNREVANLLAAEDIAVAAPAAASAGASPMPSQGGEPAAGEHKADDDEPTDA